MLWNTLVELDFLVSLIFIIVYGLASLRSKTINLADVYFISSLIPVLLVIGYHIESCNTTMSLSIELFIAVLTGVVMYSFKNFESILLLLLAFIGNIMMLHSIDFLTFFITLEAQNFCFFVLCALMSSKISSSFNVEAAIKFFVLSAFTSGVLLYWFSLIYLTTGCTTFSIINNFSLTGNTSHYSYFILCALLFKLGAAPLHLWVTQIYTGVKKQLLMYISTVPKLSLFGFWFSNFNSLISSSSVLLFSLFSLILGSFSAYNSPALRSLFAYSTINETGLMLLAVESSGEYSLYQHLGLYIISQFLLWNLCDKSFFSIVAITLAGLPPLAGFFGKAFIFWQASTVGLFTTLLVSLGCTIVSLVYYLRIIRLFWNSSVANNTRFVFFSSNSVINRALILQPTINLTLLSSRVYLTSLCVILLIFTPIFVIKPFVCFA